MRTCVQRLSAGVSRLRGTETAQGGLKRQLLRAEVATLLAGLAASHPCPGSFANEHLDLVTNAGRVGVSVHAGRAWMNNEALLSVLAAAGDPHVDWLILVVPLTYKHSAQHAHVVQQATALASAGGICLELAGLALVPY